MIDAKIFMMRLQAIHKGVRGLEDFCDAEESATHMVGYSALSYGLYELGCHLQDVIDDLERYAEPTEPTYDEGGAE